MSHNEYTWPLVLVIVAIILYVTRDYPQWKAERQRQQNIQNADINDSSATPGNIPSTTTTKELSQERQESLLSARWIPYLPLAVILVTIKAIWESLRHLILRSILAIDEATRFIAHHGPDFVRTKVIRPAYTLTTTIWGWSIAALQHSIIPAIAQFSSFIYDHLKDPVLNTLAWILRAATVMLHTTQWLLVEFLYHPALAFWERISVLGRPLALAAKTTLYGLAKDARELGQFIVKMAAWAWERILQPRNRLEALGAKLREWKDLMTKNVTEVVLPWCTQKTIELREWTEKSVAEAIPIITREMHKFGTEVLPRIAETIMEKALRPAGKAIADVVHFIETHPTFTELVQAVSVKIAEGIHVTLQWIENVNWLMLLEETLLILWAMAIDYAFNLVIEVINMITPYYLCAKFSVEMSLVVCRHVKDPTETIKFVRQHTITIRQTTRRGYRVFVSTAYHDLRMAIEIVQPIVQWLINTFVWVVRHLWQAASQLWALVYKNATLAMSWAHLHIGVPAKNAWDTKVVPGMSVAQATVREQFPLAATAIWSAALKSTVALQAVFAVLSQVMAKMAELSSAAGSHAHEQWKSVGPQYVEFKRQTGEAMDQVIQWMNDGIVDWTKNEKRD